LRSAAAVGADAGQGTVARAEFPSAGRDDDPVRLDRPDHRAASGRTDVAEPAAARDPGVAPRRRRVGRLPVCAKHGADGYNIVWNSNSISTTHHGGNLSFDYTAFAPIAKISEEVIAVAVRADSGWTADRDGRGDQGLGPPLRDRRLGPRVVHPSGDRGGAGLLGLSDMAIQVPYDEGRAPVELLAGRLDAAVQWPGQFVSHHQAGTLRILCVTSAERITMLPDVPTCIESGAPNVNMTMWRGLAAPAGTPEDVIEARGGRAGRGREPGVPFGCRDDRLRARLCGHAAFGELIARDDAMLAELMTTLGLKQ
jgi:hypothetical protein